MPTGGGFDRPAGPYGSPLRHASERHHEDAGPRGENTVKTRVTGESGAALVLAIGFVIVIGAVSASLFTTLNTGSNGRVILDRARDRQYAADGAIQSAIAQVRGFNAPTTFSGPGFDTCG